MLLEAFFIPLLVLTVAVATPQQQPFSAAPLPPHSQSISLVDLLSTSPNHTLLLHAFQRARLIPTLNRLNGSTLFAPTNDAIKAEQEREKESGLVGLWNWIGEGGEAVEGNDTKKPDNLQLSLRDTLLYHVLNYTIIAAPTNETNSTSPALKNPLPLDAVTYQETLYYPSLSPLNSSFPSPPTLPGSPPDKPDPDKPTGEEGLLRGEGQKLRLVRRESGKGASAKKELWVGTDWKGVGGTKANLATVSFAKNGALIALDEVVRKPVDLATQIRTNPRLSVLAALLPTPILEYISTASHLTLFAPTNEAWDALSSLEMRYLQSGFAETDLTVIFGDASSREGAGNGKVGYLPKLLNGTDPVANVMTILGTPLAVTGSPAGDYAVNGTPIEMGDILASNGVLHTVPSLLLPSGALSLTAEKYLIALNATRFVSLLRSVNLSSYVQVPSGPQTFATAKTAYTILAPRDDILSAWEADQASFGGKGLPSPGSPELKKILQYHIVNRKWTKEDLVDGMLLGTELRGEELKGARQQVAVSVHVAESDRSGGGWFFSSDYGKEKNLKMGVVGFGGVSVLADPVEIGNSIIYLPSSVLEPPPPVITSAVFDLRLSTFVASVYAASLDKALGLQAAVTYLIPENKAFGSLGLVMSYLLLPSSRAELRSLVRYHAIDEIVYLDGFPSGGSKRYPTLSGAEIYVERSVNSSLLVHGPTSGGLPVNGETRDAKIIEGDILTSTGVMHIIDQVELPPDMVIDLTKLLKGAKASTMMDLIRAANMSWILDGRPDAAAATAAEDEESNSTFGLGKGKKHRKKKKKRADKPRTEVAYTILCPTNKALSSLNLTHYLANPPLLEELVKLHIIPTDAFAALTPDGKPLALTDEATYPTLLDKKEGGVSQYGSLTFRRWGEDSWLVGIKSARGTNGESDSARILGYGRATPTLVTDGPDSFAGARLGLGGGVMTIDSVLLPYQPGWFRRFGWIIVLVVLGVATAVLVGLLALKIWREKKTVYEPLEGEED